MHTSVLFLIGLLFVICNLEYSDSFAESPSFKCNDNVDRNSDGIPDKIEAKSSIDWSYCNLDGQISLQLGPSAPLSIMHY